MHHRVPAGGMPGRTREYPVSAKESKAMMTVEEIMQNQFKLGQSRVPQPELKARVRAACLNWAEKARKDGIIPLSRNFNKGK